MHIRPEDGVEAETARDESHVLPHAGDLYAGYTNDVGRVGDNRLYDPPSPLSLFQEYGSLRRTRKELRRDAALEYVLAHGAKH